MRHSRTKVDLSCGVAYRHMHSFPIQHTSTEYMRRSGRSVTQIPWQQRRQFQWKSRCNWNCICLQILGSASFYSICTCISLCSIIKLSTFAPHTINGERNGEDKYYTRKKFFEIGQRCEPSFIAITFDFLMNGTGNLTRELIEYSCAFNLPMNVTSPLVI